MIRFVLRAASLLVLAAAAALAVLDATRSIAAGRLVLTPLASDWAALSPFTLERFRLWTAPPPGLGLQEPLLALPGCAVLGALALVLGLAGYRRRDED